MNPRFARFETMPAPLVVRAFALVVSLPIAAVAQRPELSGADSALVGRILLAEDRRDSSDAAIAEGLRHGDTRIRVIATRAIGRIRDPRFLARDSLPSLSPPPTWPEPAWRLRYRALTAACDSLDVAVADSALPVRLRAADLAGPGCATDTLLVSTLRRWADALPTAARGREGWHARAHALVALARLDPDDARPRISAAAHDRRWQVRVYGARAALVVKDTAVLRSLARDRDDNVKEAAVSGLSKLVGHADDELYVLVLRAMGAQAVRAAALALKGSPREEIRSTLNATFDRWVARNNASARDARVALLEAAGRPASDDRPPSSRVELPPRAVALALGADVRLRVKLASSAGGGSFVVRLRGDVAPITAARILALARSGYYNGLSWHRVEPDFVIQGGSPDANEYVGYAQFFRDELGTVPHVRGTVGMSTRGHDTGDAQWFVNLRDNLRLGRDYTVFGEVIEGIDVVDAILEGDIIASVDEVTAR
jgi:cyclophilin family peptidyl-prolyl cis-trans isomerase